MQRGAYLDLTTVLANRLNELDVFLAGGNVGGPEQLVGEQEGLHRHARVCDNNVL
jgi:hypothetical protein